MTRQAIIDCLGRKGSGQIFTVKSVRPAKVKKAFAGDGLKAVSRFQLRNHAWVNDELPDWAEAVIQLKSGAAIWRHKFKGTEYLAVPSNSVKWAEKKFFSSDGAELELSSIAEKLLADEFKSGGSFRTVPLENIVELS